MSEFRFKDSLLQKNLASFLSFQKDRQHHLDQFNSDIKTMEALFRSTGLGNFELDLEDTVSACLRWDAQTQRIMHLSVQTNPDHYPDLRPLIETSFSIRQKAKEEQWLVQLFELVMDELRNERDELGGPVWEEPEGEGESFLESLSKAYSLLDKAAEGLVPDCPNYHDMYSICQHLHQLINVIKERNSRPAA